MSHAHMTAAEFKARFGHVSGSLRDCSSEGLKGATKVVSATPSTTPQARIRHVSGRMNKTEALYAQVLESEKRAGRITNYRFEAIKIKLAGATFVTLDFFVELPGGMRPEFHEVKGHWEDDARVKIKVAAEQNRWAVFVAVSKRPARQGGGWSYERWE